MTAPTPPPERKSAASRGVQPLSPAKLFDEIGKRYDDAFADRTQQDRSIEWMLDSLPPNANVLDIGCGTGRVAAKISTKGHNVHGIDISKVMVSIAKETAPGATFEQADFRDFFVAGGTFNAVVMQFALIVNISRAQLVEAFSRVFWMLERNGLFAYASVALSGEGTRTTFLGRPIVASAFTAAETVQWLKDVGFEIVEKHEEAYQPQWVEGLCTTDQVHAEPHIYVCARKP